MSVRRLVLAALAAVPCTVAAQIIRTPASPGAPDADSSSPVGMGRRAQSDFEAYRRFHLPTARSARPSRCDEQVGNFCYWYNENEPPPPKEPEAITQRRVQFLTLLDSLARRAPDDRWIT
ncbi:MAG: hypothetical protein ACHQQ3_07935, partial [Gemmatimonadales bacterium]